ncbi:cell division protein ZipA [Bisgaardia hudsonensis]|uniref:Cell division protein ZipA n=1 Tax=Bisgaardia hudsonensis TaxID=109472 RepID=A0A4R2MZW1_9PAST|nr:cell division protein ZipA [Bisgaardia hudsonensis]QLB13772.1 cell division protein ZipA [Bisgaardia hudsonensis]TCP11745.1 cell division protein ZipA [Bisgaardia hudsonensis]
MDLNTILIILGIVALILLIVHGIWSNRKEKSQYFQNEKTFTQSARIREPQELSHNIHSESVTEEITELESKQHSLDFDNETHLNTTRAQHLEQEIDKIKITLPKSSSKQVNTPIESSHYDISQLTNASITEIEYSADPEEGINSSSPEIREQLSKIAQDHIASEDKIEYPMYSRPKPQYKTEQSVISLPTDTKEKSVETDSNIMQEKQSEQVNSEDSNIEGNFIMLYVVAPENREFNGANIAQVLDDLGFIYGEKQIYHRHLDLSITSPILFSVANIQQPGTFDPDNMVDFYTIGLAVFMQLPSYGNDLANLRLMIRATKTIAEELNGFVLTDKQEIFTDEVEQDYLNRVA